MIHTSQSLESLLSPSPPQHQKNNEDHGDGHQNADDCDHHLESLIALPVFLTWVHGLWQRRDCTCGSNIEGQCKEPIQH